MIISGGSMKNGRWEGWNRIPATRGSDFSQSSVHFPSILLLFSERLSKSIFSFYCCKEIKNGFPSQTTIMVSESEINNWTRGIEHLKTPIESVKIAQGWRKRLLPLNGKYVFLTQSKCMVRGSPRPDSHSFPLTQERGSTIYGKPKLWISKMYNFENFA